MASVHPSTSCGPAGLLGSTEPRVWTPPLRDLTPETSYGFDVVDFARDVLGAPLDPWQEWLVIHAGELLPDGRPRFRTVLTIVARQQGKSHLAAVLALYWLHVEQQAMVLSTSTTLSTAKESWLRALDMSQTSPILAPLTSRPVMINGQETISTTSGCRYRIAAATRRGGRGLTVNRLILDELREHHSWSAWEALVPTLNAVADGQVLAITNMGDDSSVVLDELRDAALLHLTTGTGDPRLGLFEWSAPEGSDPTDLQALAMANPSLGRRTDADTLLGPAIRAKEAGGEQLTGFLTEMLCVRVRTLNPAIDPGAWRAAGTDTPLDLAEHRDRVALAVDVSLDGGHATLVAAAVIEGRVHVEIVAAWDGHDATKKMRAELPAIVARVKPRVVGWLPGGPSAAVAAQLAEQKGRGRVWPPRGVKVEEIREEVKAVCMGLAEQTKAGELVHPRDPVLDAHVGQAAKVARGDAWVFGRTAAGPVDAVYATAAAVHLARVMPPPRPPLAAV